MAEPPSHLQSLVTTLLDVATNPTHTRVLAPLLVGAEAVLCGLIIWKVPYTEIDWTTYMQQVHLWLDGERSYAKLTGPTGPLVYPGLHVYLYSALSYLTSSGTDIQTAQCIFAALYLVTLALVLACYRRVGAPPWLLVPLVLSKRMHSIFLLRLFNDAWAAMGLWLCVYLFTRRKWEAATVVWGMALGIKMTILLAAPGVGLVLLQGAGWSDTFFAVMLVGIFQLVIALPFLDQKVGFEYFWKAFDLGRVFEFKWTVNWRFVGEEVFLSRGFAVALLVLHVSILVVFLQTRWVKPSSANVTVFIRNYTKKMQEDVEKRVSKKVTSTFVMDTVLASMVIGLLCARSLHYQFYAYLGWATPYLLWRAGDGPVWVLVNWAVQEYCWLVFPSTDVSSMLVVYQLAAQVLSALIAPPVRHLRDSGEATAAQLKVKAG